MWEIRSNHIIILLAIALGTLTAGCKTEPTIVPAEVTEIRRLDSTEVVIAGEPVRLAFTGNNGMGAHLQLDNSYGSALLSADNSQGIRAFSIPDPFLQMAGICSWRLVLGNRVVLEGELSILPNAESGIRTESYLGPKDLIAGSSDRAMVVTIPTDRFDNPLPYGTPVVVEERFKGENISFTDSLKKLIHWRRIQPRTESGRIFVKSAVGNSPSLEMYTDISSGMATDFMINFQRNHEYADGNQVFILETSVIKDPFENTVADGTQVTFHVESSTTGSLFSKAATVNGVATAKMVHPGAETSWKITGFIAGAASSNTLEMRFKSAVMEYEATYQAETQTVFIGPVNGFMGQIVPDFTPAEITIIYGDGKIDKVTAYTHGGYAQLDLYSILSDTLPTEFEIRILGMTKRLNP